LLPAIHSHLHQQIIPPPFGFLGLEISAATAESYLQKIIPPLIVLKIFTEQSINEENSRLFMNSIFVGEGKNKDRNLKSEIRPRNLTCIHEFHLSTH
jgi:Na+/H+ antiporter NhaC